MTDWKQASERWRALQPSEQQAQRIEAIPSHLANSMVFDGDPLPPEWLQAQQRTFDVKAAETRRKAGGESKGGGTE